MSLPDKYIVSGTPDQLVVLLPLLQALHLGLNDLKSSPSSESEEDNSHPEFRDKVKIKLIFTGKSRTGKPKRTAKSIRLVKENYRTITYEKIKDYALRTNSALNTLTVNLGKIQYNYVRWSQGYQLQQMYCANEGEARKWVEALLDIQQHSPDWDFLKNDAPTNPDGLFPEIPGKEMIAGISVKQEQKRPYGTITWHAAYIKFPKIRVYQKLCDNDGYIIPNLNFLQDYAED